MTTTTDRFRCAFCGRGVSTDHAYLRVRRDDGTGWDHTRCQPYARVAAEEVQQQLQLRRADRSLR